MNALFTFFLILFFLSPLVAAGLALYTWQWRGTRGAIPLTALLTACAFWGLFYALELLAGDNLAIKVFWGSSKYLGIVITPLAWITFALQYTNREKWLTRRNLLLATIHPVATLLLIILNPVHHWMWSQEQVVAAGPFLVLKVQLEFLFWVHAAYTYLLLVVGSLLLLQSLYRSQQLYRSQAILVVVSIIIPWASNILSIAKLTPYPDLDFTSLAFTISSIIMAISMFRYRLLDIVPVARTVIFENLSDGIFVLDAQNRIVDLNLSARQIFQLPVGSHIIGTSASQALAHWPVVANISQESRPYQQEIAIESEKGSHFFDLTLTPLRDAQEQITGKIIFLRNITRRKQEEQSLNAMRDDLTNTMIHDLRNPLGVIKSALEMLTELHEEGESDKKVIGIAQNSVENMLVLINAILDISRLESGKMPLNCEAVRLADLAQETLLFQSPLASQKKIQMENKIMRDLPLAHVDVHLIHRVFQNLISNGIKFIQENGRILVTAELVKTTLSPLLRVSISDNGPGIPEEIKGQLFQKFVTGQQRGHGSGLGLAFCRLAVEAHGGQISVVSEPEKGTTFIFTLPTASSQ